MQSLILVLLSIGAASAAPQQFFVLPDFLASAQTHSGLSHQELVPVVIPIGDHSKQKTESSSTDFDVFMKVPEIIKASSTLNEDVPSKIEGDVSQGQHSDSPNPVELLLNEMQIVQTEESLTDSETDQITTEIQQSAVPEKLSPTHDEGTQSTLEKVEELGSQLEKEEQMTEATVPSSTDLELKNEEPKENVAVEEVLDTIEKDVSLKAVENQEPIIQKQATVEVEEIKLEPMTKVEEQQHVTETIIDDKDIAAKQEAVEVADVTDETAVKQIEVIPQDVVKHEEISQGQEVNEVITEEISTKQEDKIHKTTSISTGKTLFQDTEETTNVEEHSKDHAVEEEPKIVDTQKLADHEEEVKEDSTQSTMLDDEEKVLPKNEEETLVTELPTEAKEATIELKAEKELEEELPIEATTDQNHLTEAQTITAQDQTPLKEELVQTEEIGEIQTNEETQVQTEQPESSVQVVNSEDVTQTVEAQLTEEAHIQTDLPEIPVQVEHTEDVAQQQPTEIKSAHSEDAAEAQLTEKSSLQTEQPEVSVQVSHSEDVAQQQSTEIHSSPSEDIVEAQSTEETPIQTEQPEIEAQLSEEAPIQTEQQEVSVQVPHSEDVALPQPTEVQSSLSEDTVRATPVLTKEVPATPSEDVFKIQPTLPEVQVKEEIADPNPIAESAPASPDITLSQANNFEENQIADSKVSKTKSPAKSNLIPNNGKSITSAHTTGFRMEPVGSAVQNHFGFSSHMIKMPEPTQYLHNGVFVDPRTLVEPRYRPFFYHNDSPDIIIAKVLFFQHQGNISPKV